MIDLDYLESKIDVLIENIIKERKRGQFETRYNERKGKNSKEAK